MGNAAIALGKPLLPHQQYIADVALEINPETGRLAYSDVTFVGPRQVSGKALDVATPLWTQRGWVPMGDIVPGDRVPHPDGHFVDVVFASEVMTGHDCYRVTTGDGRSVSADADHLWRVRDTYSGGARPWRTMTTAEIDSAGLRNRGNPGGWRFRLPVQQAVKTPDVSLPLDPYILGMWLGDGTAANASLTVGVQDYDHVVGEISAAGLVVKSAKQDRRTGAWAVWITVEPRPSGCVDQEGCNRPAECHDLCLMHYKRVRAHGGAMLPARVTVHEILGQLGVIRNKHVPSAYLDAGHDQRLALMQGLMDTDGCITSNGNCLPRCEFTSTTRVLAEAVLFLARSLGWRATLIEGRSTLNGRDCGPKYRVGFTATLDGPSPFRLARKAAKVAAASPRNGRPTAVSITSIEPVETRPVRCIKVASPDGLFLAGRGLMATHNTETTLPLMVHRCTGFDHALVAWVKNEFGIDVPEPGPQRVLYTAQTADAAREKWRDIHVERIKASAIRAMWSQSPRLRLNAEAMFWRSGSVWAPGATTGKTGGTGDTLDLGLIDEAWAKKDSGTELGMRPAMLTRPWRQLWRMSMIPGLSRAAPEAWPYLRQKMQSGRARVEADVRTGQAYFEWSAPLDADPHDEDVWWRCMPGLGYTVPVESVREDHDSMGNGNVDFQAEYLGWWPTGAMPTWTVVAEQTWRDLIDRVDYEDPIALAAEATMELSSASIGMAARRPDGDIHLELIDRRPGVNWILEAILSLCRSHTVCAVAIDRNGPLAGLVMPLTRAAIEQNLDITILPMNSAEVAAACAAVYNETGEQDDEHPEKEPQTLRRVHHIGQPELDAAVGGAVKHFHGDRWRWDRSGSATDVSPLFACTLARAAGESQEWIGGSYDIMDSLG